MGLFNEIYDFFNEARPRTKSAGIEDFEKSPEERRGRRDKRREAPQKAVTDRLPSDVASEKSSFEDGKVHEIWFKSLFPGQPRKYLTIYRKLSKQDFDKINNSSKLSLLGPKILVSDKEEHYRDIYYLKPDMGMSNEKDGFFSLTKKQVEEVKSKYPQYASMLELVSVDDISKGVDLKYYDFDNIKQKWDDKKASISREKKRLDTKTQKDTDKDKSVEDSVGEFLVNTSGILNDIIKFYNSANKPGRSAEDIKDDKELLSGLVKRYVDALKKESKETIVRVLSILKTSKLEGKIPLYNIIKAEYDGSPGSKADIKQKTPEPSKAKAKTPSKPSSKSVGKTAEDVEEKAKAFMIDNTHLKTLNNLIQAYEESENTDNDKVEREYQRNQIFKLLPELLKQIKKYSEDVKVKDYIVKELIRNRMAALIGRDDTELYTMLSKTYDQMKNIKETMESKKVLKEEAEIKKYAIELKPKSQADNLYTDKKVPKVFGQQHTYIRRLSDDQVKQLQKSKDVISVTPIEGDVKGYIKPSKSFKAKEKDDIVTFDPKNPKDVANLTGKVKPGEKLYSVNIKIGSAASQDVMMPLSQIEKLIPNYRLEPGIEQPFEKELFRGTSNDTGDKIYDKVKGTLKFITGKPIDGGSASQAGPILYYVVNTETKRIVKGFRTEKEAEDSAEEMGGLPNVVVSKINLPKYGIKLGMKEALSPADKEKIKSMRVSFTIQSDIDPDKQFNISDTVKSMVDEKEKFVINLTQAGTLTFDKAGTGIFKYSKDNKEYQALNIPTELSSLVKKSFEPAKDAEKEPESALEAYIRKRIKEALQETEISQYFGYQGPEVKKKRLDEYMKKYVWGFQTTEDPYQHSIGSEIHGVVTKLVHELGDEGVAIYNSYAPKGYEIAVPDDLDNMSDTPLGSQLARPYNPDELVGRGGRVAEEGQYSSIAKQQLDKLDKLNIQQKAQAYLQGKFKMSPTATKKIQDDIKAEYVKNPLAADKDVKAAFMKMSDEDLKKS